VDPQSLPIEAPPVPGSSSVAKQVLGYLFAAAGLAWVIHDVSLRELLRAAPAIDWRWIALAVVFDVSAYVCQGVRWSLLLRPLGDVPVLRATQAIYVGLFSNELLPLRIGELVRGYLVSRWIPTSFAAVLPSIIAERFFDGIWLAAGIGVAAIFVPLPRNLLDAADALGLFILIATALLAVFMIRYEDRLAAPSRDGPGWVRTWLRRLAGALQKMGRSRQFYLALAVSLLLLALQSLAFWSVMRACGIDQSVWVGLIVLLIIHLGTAIPNAPANLGSFQFFCVVGLTLFGVAKPLATGLSMISFTVLTVPLWLIGIYALAKSGTSFHQLRADVRRLMSR
jgi:glycosyltransferase 2 family protein